MNLRSFLPRQLLRLEEMSHEQRELAYKLNVAEARLRAMESSFEAGLAQQVRYLVAENVRLNELLRELINLNELKRSRLASSTKQSFDYQWRAINDGESLASNREFLATTPDLVIERTQLTREWFLGKTVLDAGCGSGRWTYAFRKLGATVTAIDQSPAGLDQTRARLKREGLEPARVIQQDLVGPMDLEPGSFDLVWCFGVAHHTEDPIKTMRNLASLVARGGWLFMMLYGSPDSPDTFATQAGYEEWRRRLSPLDLSEKVTELGREFPPEAVHGYFDAVSLPINDLFTWEWIDAFFKNEGFEEIHRTLDHPNHHFVARRQASA